MEFVKDFCVEFGQLSKDLGVSDEKLSSWGADFALEYMQHPTWDLAILDSLREFLVHAIYANDLTQKQISAYQKLFRDFGIDYNPNFACLVLTQYMV